MASELTGGTEDITIIIVLALILLMTNNNWIQYILLVVYYEKLAWFHYRLFPLTTPKHVNAQNLSHKCAC